MKKLTKYSATSKIMDLSISLDGKVYSFNLDEELKVSEEGLTGEVKNQVRSYAFLAMLHKKLIVKIDSERKALSRFRDKLLSEASKTQEKVTIAKASVSSNIDLIKKERALAEMDEVKEYLGVAVEAFRMRKDLLQTLSANTRDSKMN